MRRRSASSTGTGRRNAQQRHAVILLRITFAFVLVVAFLVLVLLILVPLSCKEETVELVLLLLPAVLPLLHPVHLAQSDREQQRIHLCCAAAAGVAQVSPSRLPAILLPAI